MDFENDNISSTTVSKDDMIVSIGMSLETSFSPAQAMKMAASKYFPESSRDDFLICLDRFCIIAPLLA